MTSLTAQEKAAIASIENMNEPEKLINLIQNARRIGSEPVERAAFLQLCSIQPSSAPGTVEYEVWRAIHALEEMLKQERGKTVRLTRTRQKISRDGEAKTAADLTLKPDASAGFVELLDRGHPELTFEAVVLRYPEVFDDETREAARRRLSAAGLDMDAFERQWRDKTDG